MPAPGRLALSHSAGLSLGEVTVTLVEGRRFFSHPALDSDEIHRGDWAEEGVRVTQAGAPSGILFLYLVNPLDGTLDVIATQVVV
jgi:hypothetical protein